jgi:hypothetical protein
MAAACIALASLPVGLLAGEASAGPPTITAVGGLADAQGSGVSSLAVSPKTVGDALVLTVKASSATATVSSVNGGGVTIWTKLVSFQDNASHDLEIWLGTVTSTGSSTITVGYSASVSGVSIELTSQEFTAGLGASTIWTRDTGGGQSNAASTIVASPAFTTAGAGELYLSYSRSPGEVLPGRTSGFTYDQTALGNMVLYDPNVSGAVAPTSTQSPANTSSAIGALIEASVPALSPPTVTGVSPTSGPAAGGTTVTITGTNFSAGATVAFGTTAATGVTVASATSLTATAPAGSGTQNVTVTTAAGTSPTSAADQYTYQVAAPSPPTVTGISPSTGPAAGGTTVTVTGTKFSAGATVAFGTTAATGVTVASATSLTATAPAGSGTQNVTVTTTAGTSAASAADQYTFVSGPPTITPVGGLADAQGSGVSSLTVSPKTVGDALVLTVKASSATATVSSVKGGGVTTWTKLVSFKDNASHDLEIWLGTVTSTGSSTIAVGYSASVSGVSVELTSQEFTAGLGGATIWTKDTGAGQSNASSTTVASPPFTIAGAGELYLSYSRSPGEVLPGSTPGFTYDGTALGNMVLYDPNVTGAVAPTSTQTPANNTSSSIGALIEAS